MNTRSKNVDTTGTRPTETEIDGETRASAPAGPWRWVQDVARFVARTGCSLLLVLQAPADGVVFAKLERRAHRQLRARALLLEQSREEILLDLCYLLECERLDRAGADLLADETHQQLYAQKVRDVSRSSFDLDFASTSTVGG